MFKKIDKKIKMKKDKKKNKKKLCYALLPCIRIIKLFSQKYHNKIYIFFIIIKRENN
jgi:hypothetical protein